MRLDQEEEERSKARRREEMCSESRYQNQEQELSGQNVPNTAQSPCNFENAHAEQHTGRDDENDERSCDIEQNGEGIGSSESIGTADSDEKNGSPDLGEACTDDDDPAEDSEDENFDPADYVGEYVDFPPSNEEEDLILGTPRTTDNTSKEPIPEDDANIISRRRRQKRISEQRALVRAKLALRVERLAARTWKPRRVLPVCPIVRMSFIARWKCELLIRAHTAQLAVQKGINIHQTTIKVQMSCRNKSCKAVI